MISLVKIDYETNICRFATDTVSELDLLPRFNIFGQGTLSTLSGCAIGSTAVVTSDSSRYILNGEQNKWIKFTGGSSGGGGGEDYDFATEGDIDNLFK